MHFTTENEARCSVIRVCLPSTEKKMRAILARSMPAEDCCRLTQCHAFVSGGTGWVYTPPHGSIDSHKPHTHTHTPSVLGKFWVVLRAVREFIIQLSCTSYLYNPTIWFEKCGYVSVWACHTLPPPPPATFLVSLQFQYRCLGDFREKIYDRK